MASPDVSTYVDLTLYDRTPEEVANDAILYAQTVLPEFTPQTGTVEDAIIQASAQMTSELIGAINRITPGVMEIVLQLFNVTRISGTRPTGSLTVQMKDNLGYTLIAGTRFGYLDSSDSENPVLYTFDTDVDLVVSPGNSSGTVAITGTIFEQYPSLQSGQALQLLTPTSFVSSAALSADLNPGIDPETDAQYFARATATLNSYTQALVLVDQMEQYILSNYSDVYRCQGYSRVNPVNDDWADPAENGYVTIYASKVGGASLSTASASAIAEDVASKSTAGLNITVKAPALVTVTVAASITIKTGYTALTVQDNVLAALSTYIHPDYWGWGEKVYYNEVISFIDQVEGVDRVTALTLNGGSTDVTFVRRGTLPTHSSTITVV